MSMLNATALASGFVLHARRWPDVRLETALDALGDGAVIVAYSAMSVGIWTRRGGVWQNAEGRTPDTDGIFQARGFDGERDLRWSAHDGTRGSGIVVSEMVIDDRVMSGDSIDVSLSGLTHRIAGVTYVLSGERSGGVGGWVALSAASFGSIKVPDPGGSGRIALAATEYLATDADGNCHVVEELLHHLVDRGEV